MRPQRSSLHSRDKNVKQFYRLKLRVKQINCIINEFKFFLLFRSIKDP